MPSPKIADYITQARSTNLSDAVIKENLLKAGWQEADVVASLTPVAPGIPVPTPDNKVENPGSGTMWDSFQHILLFISLYVMATSIALIIHDFIDRFMPGIRTGYNFGYSSSGLLQGETAALIVSFPLFAFFFSIITKRTQANPATRNLRWRKFLIYLTLIITFIIVLANVISLVYSLLGGNVTLNFFLHFLDTITVSGVVFAYYLGQVKEDRKGHA